MSTAPSLATSTVKVDVGFQFSDSGYIGLPYWPERNLLINVSKDVHPKLGDAKKQAALLAALEKRGISQEQYGRTVKRADRPFYTVGDPDDGSGEIIIPQRIFQSFLNNASQVAPRAVPRIESKGLTFIGVKLEGGILHTGLTAKDAQVFARFVKMEESNQRTWSESRYIIAFMASGVLVIDEVIIKNDNLQKLIEWAGRYVGIGSARPQGYGRFTISKWSLRV